MYAENPKEFIETYRIWIAHIEQKIDTIIWISVSCVDKTCFLRPGHVHRYYTVTLKITGIWNMYVRTSDKGYWYYRVSVLLNPLTRISQKTGSIIFCNENG